MAHLDWLVTARTCRLVQGAPTLQPTSSRPTPWIFTILLLLLIPHQVETRTVGLN